MEFRGSVNGFFTMIDDAFALHQNVIRHEGIMEFDQSTVANSWGSRRSLVQDENIRIGTTWTLERSYNSEDRTLVQAHFRTPECTVPSPYGNTHKGLELRTALDITGPMWAPHYAKILGIV